MEVIMAFRSLAIVLFLLCAGGIFRAVAWHYLSVPDGTNMTIFWIITGALIASPLLLLIKLLFGNNEDETE
jgi:uncharacterized BrkB/YihY/UPF0761 family membrane protein